MHGSGGSSDGKKRARIEIIPLIDVIFFLLATFVLFTLSLNKSEGPRVNLPDAELNHPRDPDQTVTLTVTRDGTIAWNKEERVTLDVFIDKLQRFHLEHPEWRVLINADKDAEFSRVVYVLDEVRKAQFKKVFIETQVSQKK